EPAARLVVLRLSLVEEDAVARFQFRRRRLGCDQHVPRAGVHFEGPADEHAPVAGIEAMDELLVIRAAQEAVREAAAEAVAQLFLVAAGESGDRMLRPSAYARRRQSRLLRPSLDGGVERAPVL